MKGETSKEGGRGITTSTPFLLLPTTEGFYSMFHFYNTLSITGKYVVLVILTALIIVLPFYIGGAIEAWLGLKGVH